MLRDGASSQYGSDAIAGVMNFILNDADHGANLEARYGGYYAPAAPVYYSAPYYAPAFGATIVYNSGPSYRYRDHRYYDRGYDRGFGGGGQGGRGRGGVGRVGLEASGPYDRPVRAGRRRSDPPGDCRHGRGDRRQEN